MNLIVKSMGLIINIYLEWVVVIMLTLFLESFSCKNYGQIVLSKVSRICWKCTTCPNLFSPSIPHLPEGCKIEAPHLILLRFSVLTAVLRSLWTFSRNCCAIWFVLVLHLSLFLSKSQFPGLTFHLSRNWLLGIHMILVRSAVLSNHNLLQKFPE